MKNLDFNKLVNKIKKTNVFLIFTLMNVILITVHIFLSPIPKLFVDLTIVETVMAALKIVFMEVVLIISYKILVLNFLISVVTVQFLKVINFNVSWNKVVEFITKVMELVLTVPPNLKQIVVL